MPTIKELERLPLVSLARLCRQISNADDASFPLDARQEAHMLWEEWFAVEVRKEDNYETREADLKKRAIDFLSRTC